MIGADLGRALLLLALPIAAALGMLRLDLIFVFAFLLGSLDLVFGAAYGAFLPVVTPAEQLIEVNSRLATSAAASAVAGPGLAGLLVQWFGAPVAVLGDALSFLASACSLLLIRTPEPAPPAREHRQPLWREIAAGLRVLRDNRILFAFVASSMTLDVFWNALMAVYFLYLTRSLGLPAAAFGLIFGIGSAGGLTASVVAPRVPRRLGLGRTLIAAQFGTGAGGFLIALAVGLPTVALPLLIAAELVQSSMNTLVSANSGGLAG